MVINVNIRDDMERMLAEQAAMRGQSVESYATELIRKGVCENRTFAEILAPFCDQVQCSEILDDELDGLLKSARIAVHETTQEQK